MLAEPLRGNLIRRLDGSLLRVQVDIEVADLLGSLLTDKPLVRQGRRNYVLDPGSGSSFSSLQFVGVGIVGR